MFTLRLKGICVILTGLLSQESIWLENLIAIYAYLHWSQNFQNSRMIAYNRYNIQVYKYCIMKQTHYCSSKATSKKGLKAKHAVGAESLDMLL